MTGDPDRGAAAGAAPSTPRPGLTREGATADLTALRDELARLEEQVRHLEASLGERDQALRRAERMAALGHTLAGVAHELNNPLAAISGFAQLLLRPGMSEEDQSALETIAHEAARAARIVKGLLAFSRRQGTGSREAVDLSDVATYILQTQRYAMETRGIRAEGALAAHLPPVFADRANLEQLVLNLVVNARQALESGVDGNAFGAAPCITVATRDDGEFVTLVVADNGPGIPPAVLAHIWDPFVTTKSEQEGTGLGLSMVHGIVISHGGTIDVESRPGAGAAFTVTFPAYRGHEDRDAAPPGGTGAVRGPGPVGGSSPSAVARTPPRALDILVVDDEPAILAMVERYFTSRGHAVVAASDGEEALRLAAGTAFDVVICDLRMPGMDGFEVIRRLRAAPASGATRFIITTGDNASPASRRGIAASGVDAVLPKPFDMGALREAVERGG